MSWPNLSKPPITEALLDLQIGRTQAVSLKELDEFGRAVIAEFPERKTRKEVMAGIQIKEDGTVEHVTPKPEMKGYLWTSADKGRVVQARLDGFTFNKVGAYQGWDAFEKDARRLWDVYANIIHPTAVKRLGLRYINRIEAKGPSVEIEHYFRTLPKISPDLPDQMTNHFMRVELEDSTTGLHAVVTQTVEPPPKDRDVIPFILDIDVYDPAPIEPENSKIWEKVKLMRALKNRIFFGSLTPATLELLK